MKKKSIAARNAARRARTARRFGPDAACLICGYSNPIGLVWADKTLLEEHHVLGAANNDDVRVPLCRNHHAEIEFGIQETGATRRRQRSIFERLIEAGRMVAVLGRSLAIAEGDFGLQAERLIHALDEQLPQWRKIEEDL